MIRVEPPIDISNRDTFSGGSLPCLINPTTKDVPLILEITVGQANGRHDLVAIPKERLVERTERIHSLAKADLRGVQERRPHKWWDSARGPDRFLPGGTDPAGLE